MAGADVGDGEGVGDDQRAVVAHHGRGAVGERGRDVRGQLVGAERRVVGHGDPAAEDRGLVVHERHVVAQQRQRDRRGRVGVHHRPGVVVPVAEQVQRQLAGRAQVPVDDGAVEVDEDDVLGVIAA